MILRHYTFIILCILSLTSGGCDQLSGLDKTPDQPANTSVQKVQDAELAKMLLKPKIKKLDVTKDPFTPIFLQKEIDVRVFGVSDPGDIKYYKFKGLTQMGGEYIAFLQKGKEKGAYRVNDQILGYTIKEINEDQIILKNGVQIVTLRRDNKDVQNEDVTNIQK